VGETSNLQTREHDHNDGRGGSYTAKRRPVHIVYAEQYSSREEALRRERQLKRWSSHKKELLVHGDVPALSGNSQRARIRTGFTWEDWLTQL
jgi:predicted GIY-YIG superfamily endonuclease